MKFRKHTFIIALFVALFLVPGMVLALEPGEQAPGFTLKSVQGKEVSLSDFRGRVVLLKLATTWCPTCKQLSAEIEKAGPLLQEKGVVVLEVFVQDSQSLVEKYLGDTEFPMTFHALIDDGQAYKDYNVYLIPRLLVIDAEQTVRFDSAGRNVLAEDIAAMVETFSPVKAPAD